MLFPSRLNKPFQIAALILGGLAVAIVLLFQLPPFGGRMEGARLQRMKKSPEYVNGRFENDPPQNTNNSLIANFKLYQGGQIREPQFEIPVLRMEPPKGPPKPGLRAFWFGHASTLVEIDGVRVMTDPVLSEYASPFAIGPKRLHAPPLLLKELSGIDAVVISHDHYDHLDMDTIKHLSKQGTHFYVGLGVGAHLERWNVPSDQIHEMDWWETAELKGVKIHCTPTRHYSGRKKMDNSTLWASWTVRGPKHSFYFSGDTGYGPHFSQVKNRLGSVDLALIKVGAYGLTWLDIHMDPESAVKANLDLGAKTLLPVHWATFNLSYHSWEEPILRTVAAAKSHQVNLVTPRVGEKVEIGEPFHNLEWYKQPTSGIRLPD